MSAPEDTPPTPHDEPTAPREDAEAPDSGAQSVPPPATYAGRQRQESADPEPAEQPPPADGEKAEAGGGAEPEPESAPAIEARGDGGPAPPPESGKTIEADTVALADREEAQEAALHGVRARAAAKTNQTDQRLAAATAPVAPVAAPPVAAPPSPPAAATPPPTAGAPSEPPPPDVGEPPKRGVWWRFLAAAVVIVAAAGTATAVSGLVFGYNLAAGLGGIRGVQHLLQDASPSAPQTILVLGSDKRPGETDHGRSDTTILLRITSNGINMLSIPRDLKIDNIPGHGGPWKMNAAYTFGGPTLTTKVVKQLTGLQINHVVNVDFTGFADAVDSIGCVYFDVDHHYFHSNAGLAAIDQYAAINIHAGYQRMCGYNALQFVRYRHDDNDLVRSARQQAFLREARRQVPTTKILGDFNNLAHIVGKYTSTDPQLRDFPTLESLAKLLVSAGGAPITQIHFPAIFGAPTDPYVTAHETKIHAAVRQLLGQSTASTAAPPTAGAGGSQSGGSAKPKGAGSSKSARASSKLGGGSPSGSSGPLSPAPEAGFIDSTTSGQQYAAKLSDARWRREGKIPILYPTKLVPGSIIAPDSDSYRIDGPGDQIYDGYTFVAEIPAGTAGYGYSAYYDFTGTNWPDPPILDSPSETKDINGQSYEMFWDNGRLRLVGWKTPKGSYWVDNDLLETLTPGQMVAMAEAMRNSKG